MVSTKKPNRKIAILVIRPPKGRGGRNIPVALDKGVGSAPIVHLDDISIQAQITKKKPYQMCAQGFGLGGWRGPGLARSACEPGLEGMARYLRQPLHFPLKWRPQPQQ